MRSRSLVPVAVVAALVALPAVAGAQTPLPGQLPEISKPWTWYMSWPVVAGALGLLLLLVASYLRLANRFYGSETEPAPRPRPQYAGIHAPAYPAPAAPAPAPAAEAPAPPAEPKAEPAPDEKEEAPAGAPPAEVPAEPEPEPKPESEPAAEPEPEPAAEPETEPAAEPETEPKAESAPEPKPAAGGGDDVYERVLKDQLDKGVSPKVAEGRAKAAALKAKREAG